jgi:hypothetical protein
VATISALGYQGGKKEMLKSPENRIFVLQLWFNDISMLINSFGNFESGKDGRYQKPHRRLDKVHARTLSKFIRQ